MGNIISGAARAFPDTKIPLEEEFFRNVIEVCGSIYRGEPPWAYVKRSGLYGKGERRIAQMGCAKVLCDSLASLTFSSQADIFCKSPAQQEYALRILQENGFWEKAPAFFSRAYALGGGAMKIYIDGGRVSVDYISAEDFIPTGSGRGGICEGIFGSRFLRGGREFALFERHGMKGGHAVIDRRLFEMKGGSLSCEIPVEEVFGGLSERSEYPSMDVPMFAYFRPAGDNNLSEGSLLGLSCFANCTDTLKALDIAFDSFSREFVLGRKRIIVPSSCIRTVVDPDTGRISRYFDADDEVYQALKCDEEQELKITDNTCELRVSEHVEAINALLDILCFQAGLSSGTLSFNSSAGLRTAAEVKSMETRTEITMQTNRCLAAELIENAVRCIIRCGQMCGALPLEEVNVRVAFSDRQTVDRDEIIDRNIRLVEAGLISRVSAVMAALECSEEDAVRELEKIEKERSLLK
ncbi:MAG: phage portal protein [Huintestinicola sp.]|uniref:phage portal protein n=1 Tax=Huintestinicola sp. TaxID=2981661 RepID=UPI003F03D24E